MIFVTGGTGFLGSHLLASLSKGNDEIVALKRKGSSAALTEKIFRLHGVENKFSNIRWAEGDVCEYFSVEDAMQSATQVYHCASVVSFLKKDKKRMMEINAGGTAHVVNAALALNVQKFCHVSSIATLGRNAATGLFDEETLWEESSDNSNYSKSKWKGELEVWRGIAEGLNAVIVNPAVILGAGDWKNGSPALFNLVKNGLKYYTPGMNGYVCVDDVVRSMQELMNSEISGERFIVSAEDISYEDLFSRMAAALTVKAPHVGISKSAASFAVRLEAIRSFFSSSSARISKETVNTAFRTYKYNNEKIKKAVNFKFSPVNDCINNTAELLLKGF
ncbi:MAG: NAD-dependent epimerase/dehydratase family protein [Bacteroidota bacterium]